MKHNIRINGVVKEIDCELLTAHLQEVSHAHYKI